MGVGVAIAGLIVSAGSAVVQYQQAEKRADIEEEARDVQGAQQDVDQINARRRQVREQRVRQAQIEQASINTGVGASSGEAGAISSLATNVMSNVAVNAGQTRTAGTVGGLAQSAADTQTTSALWGAAGQLGGQVFNTSMANKETKESFYNLFS